MNFSNAYIAAAWLGSVSVRDLPGSLATGGIAGDVLMKSYTRRTGPALAHKQGAVLDGSATLEAFDGYLVRIV
jgi:hypothetical protein